MNHNHLLHAAGLMAMIAMPWTGGAVIIDTAADVAYDDGWQVGDNGGTGWGAWTFSAGTVGDSASNGNGDTVAPAGDINTAGRAWGMSGEGQAYRPFGTVPQVGQTITLDVDTGTVDAGGSVVWDVRIPGFYWSFYYLGTAANYRYYDANGIHDSGIPYTDEGLHIAFTLTGPNAYSAEVNILGASPTTYTGPWASGSQSLAGILFSVSGTGSGTDHISYLNSMHIEGGSAVPEPSTVFLFGVGGLTVVGTMRRRRERTGKQDGGSGSTGVGPSTLNSAPSTASTGPPSGVCRHRRGTRRIWIGG